MFCCEKRLYWNVNNNLKTYGKYPCLKWKVSLIKLESILDNTGKYHCKNWKVSGSKTSKSSGQNQKVSRLKRKVSRLKVESLYNFFTGFSMDSVDFHWIRLIFSLDFSLDFHWIHWIFHWIFSLIFHWIFTRFFHWFFTIFFAIFFCNILILLTY